MPGRKRRIQWGWIAAAAVVCAGGAWALWRGQAASQGEALPRGVQVGVVSRGNLDQTISASGVVAAQTGAKVNIGSQITGRIRRLPADVGAVVEKDQVIAILDAPDLEAQVEQQRRNVEVARANVAQAETRLRQAELAVLLTERENRAQIEEAHHAVQAARARLEAAEASEAYQPAQTEAEIRRAEAALSTARSAERQVRQSVAQQLLQAQTAIDEARAQVERLQRLRRRQEALRAQGYLAQQELDDTIAQHRQALARLQSAEANLRLVQERTTADLQNAQDQVTQAQAALDAARAGDRQNAMRAAEARNAREAVRQAEALLALRLAGRTQERIRRQALAEAQAGLRQARAALRQAEALLRYQQAQLDKAIIRSPIRGTVLSIAAQQGETVAAGLSAPTLITVADLDRLEVRAYVDETDIGRVRLGLPAEVRVESFQDRVFHGRVAKIAAASTIKDNVVTYETTIALTDPQRGLLRPDMTADVTLILGRRPNVLRVPSEAVHRAVDRAILYVLHRERRGKERVEEREVRIGFSDGSYTEILSGAREGEEVILAGLARLGVQAVDAQSARPNRRQP